MSLKDATKYVCDNYVGLASSARGRFTCAEGWYDYDLIKSADDYCSGIVNGHTLSVTYSFYRKPGADAVLKKLGSVNTVSFRVRSNKVDNNNTIWIDNLESLKKVTLTLTTAQAFQGVPRIVANGITVVEQYLTQGQSMSYSLTSDITSLYIVIVNNTENSVWTVTLEYE